MNRRNTLKTLGSSAALLSLGFNPIDAKNVMQRRIPSSNEQLPTIGVGTWQTFDVGGNRDQRAELKKVLSTLLQYGGSVIDSSPMYGSSEKVVGDLTDTMQDKSKFFKATKVWTRGKDAGISQMKKSFDLMAAEKMDLMQIHNLLDWKTHYKTLEGMKERGQIRYLGITHYTRSAYDQMEDIMKSHPLDFIQINYSINAREAENRLLPLAKEKGIAVLINRPFGGGGLFGKVRGKELPSWASEFDCKTWGNFFLKFVLANDAVTCAIPGTGKVSHMVDNMQAGIGALPSKEHLKKMVALFS